MITLTIGSQDVNDDMTESEFDSFVSFVADRIDERTGLTVQVDSAFGGGTDTITRATAEQADTIREAVQTLWTEWCETSDYTISTDSGSVTITALNADEAAREYARREDMDGIEDADDLRAYVERKGGYGFLEGSDGERVWTVAQ